MKIKTGLSISTDDFYYDLAYGGYLNPYEICENEEDAKEVERAVRVLKDFEESCTDQINGFIL